MNNKVCIVAPVHVWDDVRVYHKEACSLAKNGWNVYLIAQANKAFAINDVNVIPAKVKKEPRWKRFLGLQLVLWQAIKVDATVYHMHNPDTIPLAFLLKIIGKIVVYDTHEDFTKRIMIRNWVPITIRNVVAYAVGLSEKLLAKMLDASIATQIDVVSRLGKKAILIGNAPRFSPELIKDVKEFAQNIEDNFDGLRAIYIGGLSYSRGLFDMINAVEIANEIVPVRIWLIGTVDQKDLRDARSLDGWKYVDYHERMPQLEAFAYVSKSDVGLIVLRKVGGHEYTDPNKIYEYLTFKVPFIASEFLSWLEKFQDVGAGCFVPPGDFEKLSQKLIEFAKSPKERADMGDRGYKYVEKHNWNQEEIKLLNLYDAVVKNKAI